MDANRRTASIVGGLFIIGTVAGVLSLLVAGPLLNAPDYLIKIAGNQNQLIFGALLTLVMGFALAGVPLVMYPVFKKRNETISLGYLIFRGAWRQSLIWDASWAGCCWLPSARLPCRQIRKTSQIMSYWETCCSKKPRSALN